VLQIASALGVKKIRTFVDCGPDGLSSGRAKEAHWEAACRGLKELCEMDPSTDFVVETHENTLADTLPSVERLLKDVAKRNLRLNYQATADFLERGYLACIETLFPVIAHMHWEQIRPDGRATYIEEEGLIDFGELIELLTIKGYTGTASVEYCWTPVEAGRVNSAWRHLAGLLSQSKPGASDLLGCGQPGS
jgi:sugar phosphate isomerase/epimerase